MIPNGFLQIPNGTVDYASVSLVTYTGLPTDGVHALDAFGATIQNVATNFADATASVVPSGPPPPPPPAAELRRPVVEVAAGSESGWGINLAHQGDVIFVTWFTYDLTGKAWWLSMTANKTADGVYSGTLYQTHGPAFSAVPFNPAAVTATQVGTGTLTFTDADTGTVRLHGQRGEPGQGRSRTGVRAAADLRIRGADRPGHGHQLSGPVVRGAGGVGGGVGVNFTHQGDTIFATWFTYDADGTPLWLLATLNKTGPASTPGSSTARPGRRSARCRSCRPTSWRRRWGR